MNGSTMHICRRDLFLLCLTSGFGWVVHNLADLLRLEFLVPAHLLVNYISSPHRKFRSRSGLFHLLLYDDFLLLVPPCLLDRLDGWLPLICWYRCTVTDVLFAHMTSSCASSSSCANCSYCTMLCTMRIQYGFVSLVGRDVTLLCVLCWLYELCIATGVNTGGWGHLTPNFLQGMTRECHWLGKGGL